MSGEGDNSALSRLWKVGRYLLLGGAWGIYAATAKQLEAFAFTQQHLIALFAAFFAAICVVVYSIIVFSKPLSERLQPCMMITGHACILAKLRELIDSAESIIYVGRLDLERARLFADFVGNSKNATVEFELHVTDASFYTSQDSESAEAYARLIALDRTSDKFTHSFYCYRQSHDVVHVIERGKTRTMQIFEDGSTTPHAVLVTHPGRLNMNLDRDVEVPITFDEQARSAGGIRQQIVKHVSLLRDGWFEPIFPPWNHATGREWSNAILTWFCSVAEKFYQQGAKTIHITWSIEETSRDDALAFKRWLNLLRCCQGNVNVVRYMLVDTRRYESDSAYRGVVSDIAKDYLPSGSNGPYQTWYVDVNIVPSGARDCAIFTIGDRKLGQKSGWIEIGGRHLLRVFFTQNSKEVRDLETIFKNLDDGPKHRDLSHLNAAS